jgi:hypothetical protein
VLEFCRDDPKDDVQELYLVVTNHDRRPGQQVTGDFQIELRATCPSGWSGSIDYVSKVDEERSSMVAGTSDTTSRHQLVKQSWTVVDTIPAEMSMFGTEQLKLSWHGSVSLTGVVTEVGPGCSLHPPTQGSAKVQSEMWTGEGSGTRLLAVFAAGTSVSLTPFDAGSNQITGTKTFTAELCSGEVSMQTSPLSPISEALDALIGTPAFNPLMPSPGDPNHFAGSATVLHSDQPSADGTLTLDATLKWDLTRKLH